MRKINNPFTGAPDWHEYNCFGCSPTNEIGLQMEFWDNGEEIIAKWMPRKSMEGWTGVLHGGIQATLMDELAAWVVFTKLETSGVTKDLNVEYLSPVYISNNEITLHGKVLSTEKRLAIIHCTLFDSNKKPCSRGQITYFYFPEKIAKIKYHYPGVDAFYR